MGTLDEEEDGQNQSPSRRRVVSLRADSETADLLYRALGGIPKMDRWLDSERLEPGDDLPVEIADRIRAAKVFIPVVSGGWRVSPWCQREWAVARSVEGLAILPLLVDGDLPPDMTKLALTLDVRRSRNWLSGPKPSSGAAGSHSPASLSLAGLSQRRDHPSGRQRS